MPAAGENQRKQVPLAQVLPQDDAHVWGGMGDLQEPHHAAFTAGVLRHWSPHGCIGKLSIRKSTKLIPEGTV